MYLPAMFYVPTAADLLVVNFAALLCNQGQSLLTSHRPPHYLPRFWLFQMILSIFVVGAWGMLDWR
jgi:hypothetical protein